MYYILNYVVTLFNVYEFLLLKCDIVNYQNIPFIIRHLILYILTYLILLYTLYIML